MWSVRDDFRSNSAEHSIPQVSPRTFSLIHSSYYASSHRIHRTSYPLSRGVPGATMSSVSTLSAAATDRKARLAALKNLKRKAPDTPAEDQDDPDDTAQIQAAAETNPHLSGRNYDTATRGPKLGFELAPSAQSTTATAEERASLLAATAREEQQAAAAAAAEGEIAPLDLSALQPKKANWDLKRELERRMDESGLNVRTENAVARLVRERIEGQKKKDAQQGKGGGDQEEVVVGMEGSALVEATREREKEDEEESRRERKLEAELEAP